MTEKNLHGSEFLVFPHCAVYSTLHSVEKREILSKEIFRQINSLVTYLVKKLVSSNFCQKCVKKNSRNFHTVRSKSPISQFSKYLSNIKSTYQPLDNYISVKNWPLNLPSFKSSGRRLFLGNQGLRFNFQKNKLCLPRFRFLLINSDCEFYQNGALKKFFLSQIF